MAAPSIYISAGLPVSKEGDTPSGNTAYLSAGLPPEVEAEAPPAGGLTVGTLSLMGAGK